MREAERSERFFEVPEVRVAVSAGEVSLPIHYRDARVAHVAYLVDADRAAAVLAPVGLAPLRLRPGGRGLVILSWFDYRDTSIGPYHELSIALAAHHPCYRPHAPLRELFQRPAPGVPVGGYVLHLPVTTELACAAGRELWGYPKFVADIPMHWTGKALDAALVDPSGPEPRSILTMHIPTSGILPGPPTYLCTLSLQREQLLKTVIETRGTPVMRSGRGVTLQVGAPEHPVGQTLRALGICDAQGVGVAPSMVATVSHLRSLLPHGLPIASAPAPTHARNASLQLAGA